MNLIEDIVVEILSRLPVRSLIRFKCVSKTWHAIIGSPNFVQMHLALQLTKRDEHIQMIGLLNCRNNIVRHFENFQSLSAELTPLPPYFELPGYETGAIRPLTHSNGIVCITDYHLKITLWNPALREFRLLPTRPIYSPFNNFHCGFDGMVLGFGFGFGFDDVTNDYKVVCLEQSRKEVEPRIEVVQVYSLKTNSWRKLETMRDEKLLVPEFGQAPFPGPVFLNRTVHWAEIKRQVIFTFDITTELFSEFPYPQHYHFLIQTSRLFLYDNSVLSLVVYFPPSGDSSDCQQIDVWMMKDYNVKEDSWIKQYVITSGPDFYFPLCFLKNDRFLLLKADGVLIYYDLPTGQQHHLRDFGTFRYNEAWSFQAVVCIETLVSIL